jgi:hypothetical protein
MTNKIANYRWLVKYIIANNRLDGGSGWAHRAERKNFKWGSDGDQEIPMSRKRSETWGTLLSLILFHFHSFALGIFFAPLEL